MLYTQSLQTHDTSHHFSTVFNRFVRCHGDPLYGFRNVLFSSIEANLIWKQFWIQRWSLCIGYSAVLARLSGLSASYTSKCVQVPSNHVCRLNVGKSSWLMKSSSALQALRNLIRNDMEIFHVNVIHCNCACSLIWVDFLKKC